MKTYSDRRSTNTQCDSEAEKDCTNRQRNGSVASNDLCSVLLSTTSRKDERAQHLTGHALSTYAETEN
jgi:hypothetical protein